MPTDTSISPKFGVEIEFATPREGFAIADHLSAAGVSTAFEDYNHQVRHYWKVTTDSSCGLEVVSPPLEWHQRLTLRKVMQVLRDLDCEITKDCGFHVHHEWPWRDALPQSDKDERLLRLRKLYRSCEPLLRALMPASRWSGNTFCVFDPVPSQAAWPDVHCSECDSYNCSYCAECDCHDCYTHASEMEHSERNRPCDDDIPRSSGEDLHQNRYQAVNFVSLNRQPTVEFRQHQGTLNATKALAWIELTRNFTHAASRPGLSDRERFDFIFDKLSTSTRRYLDERTTEAGVSLNTLVGASLRNWMAS